MERSSPGAFYARPGEKKSAEELRERRQKCRQLLKDLEERESKRRKREEAHCQAGQSTDRVAKIEDWEITKRDKAGQSTDGPEARIANFQRVPWTKAALADAMKGISDAVTASRKREPAKATSG